MQNLFFFWLLLLVLKSFESFLIFCLIKFNQKNLFHSIKFTRTTRDNYLIKKKIYCLDFYYSKQTRAIFFKSRLHLWACHLVWSICPKFINLSSFKVKLVETRIFFSKLSFNWRSVIENRTRQFLSCPPDNPLHKSNVAGYNMFYRTTACSMLITLSETFDLNGP